MGFAQWFLLLMWVSNLRLAQGWDATGHEVIATIAQVYLHPVVLPTICNLLDTRVSSSASVAKMRTKCHLSSVAAWADRERKRMWWSSPMHYVSAIGDDPPSDCNYSRTRPWHTTRRKGNVLDATRNFTRILAEWSGVNEVFDRQTYGPLKVGKPDEEAPIHNSWPNLPLPGQKEKEALKFLVHFLGDMHQPLHLTGKGRGGNDIKVQFEGRPTSLHSLWDGALITKLSRAVPWNYTKPLYNSHTSMLLPNSPTIEAALKGSPHHRWIRKILWEGIAHRWESEVKSWLLCPGSYNRNSSWNGLLETTQLIFSLVFDPTQSKGGQIAEDGPLVCPTPPNGRKESAIFHPHTKIPSSTTSTHRGATRNHYFRRHSAPWENGCHGCHVFYSIADTHNRDGCRPYTFII